MESRPTPIILGCGLLGLAIIGYVILSYGPTGNAEQARGLLLYVIPLAQLLFQRGQIGATQDKLDQKLPDQGATDGKRENQSHQS